MTVRNHRALLPPPLPPPLTPALPPNPAESCLLPPHNLADPTQPNLNNAFVRSVDNRLLFLGSAARVFLDLVQALQDSPLVWMRQRGALGTNPTIRSYRNLFLLKCDHADIFPSCFPLTI